MAGSDAGDDEDDSAMATVPTEKVDSDEDSDRGSDHSGLKRKSLAMKVSVGWGQEGGPARGHRGSTMELSSNPLCQEVVEKPTPSGFCGGKWGSAWFWGSHSCLMMPVGWWDGQSWWGLQPGGESRAADLSAACCRAGWEELEKALPGKHLLSRVGGEGVGFSHLVISPLPDASDKTASEILQ